MSQTTEHAVESYVEEILLTREGWKFAAVTGKVDGRPNAGKITP
jgi:hypothetical protein